MPATRFVILNHRVENGEHWDLMIERPEATGRDPDFHGLATWQLTTNPVEQPNEAIAGRQLADHRMVYLDYEGPISGDRGTVTRVEKGTCELIEAGERIWRVNLQGKRLKGMYSVTLSSAGFWTFLRATGSDD